MTKHGAVIFDFNRTLFDPTVYGLYNGVVPMLEEVGKEKKLILYSRKSWDRHLLLDKLGISKYFDAAYFVEKKTPESLSAAISEHGISGKDCIIVGDMISDELCAGSELGMTTVWFQQSRFGSIYGDQVDCAPLHTVHTIDELRSLLRTL